jgi:MFS family permease
VGYITTAMFATSVVGTLLVPWMVARSGYAVTLLIGVLVTAIAAAAVPLTSDVLELGVTQALNGFGRGSTNALLITLAVLAVAPAQRATAMGVYQAVYAIGMLSGPVVSGAVADAVGIEAVFYLSTAVALAGGVLVFARPLPRS